MMQGKPPGFIRQIFFGKYDVQNWPCVARLLFHKLFEKLCLWWMIAFHAVHQTALRSFQLYPYSPGNDGNGSIAKSSPSGRGAKDAFGLKMCRRRKAKDKHPQLGEQGRMPDDKLPPVLPAQRSEQEANKHPLENHKPIGS
jgi:hypothetical protein